LSFIAIALSLFCGNVLLPVWFRMLAHAIMHFAKAFFDAPRGFDYGNNEIK
jgi:hypothetical protein